MYRSLADGGVITVGGVTIWRSPLILAGDSTAALFLCDTDTEPGMRPPRLGVYAYQLIRGEWVHLSSLGGGGGGARTVLERGSVLQRSAKWLEFELPAATATGF